MRQIKICGIRDEAFALAAAQAGVDFLGFIFARKSPRCITPGKAHSIRNAILHPHTHDIQASYSCPKTRFVGVFVEQSIDEILEIASSVPLDIIQLHSPAYSDTDVQRLKSGGYEVWRLDSPTANAADAILIDGTAAGVFGGTGQLADWSRIDELKRLGRRVILAGGIGKNNIAAALATNADIIDVNSSLETSPGQKSIPLLKEFIAHIPQHAK